MLTITIKNPLTPQRIKDIVSESIRAVRLPFTCPTCHVELGLFSAVGLQLSGHQICCVRCKKTIQVSLQFNLDDEPSPSSDL